MLICYESANLPINIAYIFGGTSGQLLKTSEWERAWYNAGAQGVQSCPPALQSCHSFSGLLKP